MRFSKCIILVFTLVCFTAKAQIAAYSDPAAAYNKLLIEKNNGIYTQVGNYHVIGTPYLFGEKHNGSLFLKDQVANNIFLSYNTFEQKIDFFIDLNQKKPLSKESSSVDSFIINSNIGTGIQDDIKFVNGANIGSTAKFYFQEVSLGNKVSLYKKYVSTLEIVSTNYVQSELRQFELQCEYYYYSVATKELKKLKLNEAFLKKEFKNIKDISPIVEGAALGTNPEASLKMIFTYLNL